MRTLLTIGVCVVLAGCGQQQSGHRDNAALFSHCLDVDVSWGTQYEKRDVMLCYRERGVMGIEYTLGSYSSRK